MIFFFRGADAVLQLLQQHSSSSSSSSSNVDDLLRRIQEEALEHSATGSQPRDSSSRASAASESSQCTSRLSTASSCRSQCTADAAEAPNQQHRAVTHRRVHIRCQPLSAPPSACAFVPLTGLEAPQSPRTSCCCPPRPCRRCTLCRRPSPALQRWCPRPSATQHVRCANNILPHFASLMILCPPIRFLSCSRPHDSARCSL